MSFAVCLWGSYHRPAFTFYWLPTRIWELFLGGFFASAGFSIFTPTAERKHLPRAACEVLGWGGMALVLASFFAEGCVFPGWVVLLPTLGAACVLLSITTGKSTFCSLLSTTPFTGVGKLSYSLYLWHWPLIVFARMRAELSGYEWDEGAHWGSLASIGLATAAYFLVERPLRRRGPGRGRRLAIIALLFSATLALCVWNAWLRPFKTFPQFDPVTVSADYYDLLLPKTDAEKLPLPPKPGSPVGGGIFAYDVTSGKIHLEGVKRKVLENGGLLHLHGGETPKIVLWGSSHANMLAPMLDELCRERKLSIAFFGKSAEPAFNVVSKVFPQSRVESVRKFHEHKMRWLREWEPEVLFLCERWDRWYAWDGGDLTDFARQFDAFLEEMKPLRTKIVLVTQVPVSPHGEQMNPRAVADFLSKPGVPAPPFQEPRYFVGARAAQRAVLDAAQRRHPNLIILRPEERLLNPDGTLRYSEGRKFYYFDEDHLNDTGAKSLAPLFAKFLETQK